eukprot:RCo015956
MLASSSSLPGGVPLCCDISTRKYPGDGLCGVTLVKLQAAEPLEASAHSFSLTSTAKLIVFYPFSVVPSGHPLNRKGGGCPGVFCVCSGQLRAAFLEVPSLCASIVVFLSFAPPPSFPRRPLPLPDPPACLTCD